jgi:hypothetical protein
MAAKETVLVLEHPPYFSHLDPMWILYDPKTKSLLKRK